jgi:signal-transduction protein with cAMP-binding, CBS, and nucleotidyltransferase domain
LNIGGKVMQNIKFLDIERKRELLSKVDVFADFTPFEIPRIAEICSNITYCDQGEKLIVQGSHGDCFYILLSGSVSVFAGNETSGLFLLKAGAIFGEIAFLSGTARTRHVVANEEAFVLRVTQDMLKRLPPEMREKIKDKLIEKLVERIQVIEEYGKSNGSVLP